MLAECAENAIAAAFALAPRVLEPSDCVRQGIRKGGPRASDAYIRKGRKGDPRREGPNSLVPGPPLDSGTRTRDNMTTEPTTELPSAAIPRLAS